MSDDRWHRLGVFTGVIVAVLLGAALVGFVAADAPPERTDATVDNEQFTSPDLLADSELTPRSSEIEFAAQPSRTVLVSTDGDPTDLEPVVDALVAHGHDVRLHGGGTGTVPAAPPVPGVQTTQTGVDTADGDLAAALDDSDAFLIIGGSQFDEDDHDTIEEFADAGGPVVLATDSTGTPAGSSVNPLTSRFGITVGDGYLYDMHDNDANFQRIYADGTDVRLADDVDEVVLDGATPVRSSAGTALVTADGDIRYSTTRESGAFDVAVQSENVVVIGDSDVVRPLNYNRADNEQLIGNVLEFLTSGPVSPYSPVEDEQQTELPRTEPPQTEPQEAEEVAS